MNPENENSFFLERIEEAIKGRNYLDWVAYADKLLRCFKRETIFNAEDLVHEVIIKTVEGIRKFNNQAAIDAYMKMCIKSEAFNLMKKERRAVKCESANKEKTFIKPECEETEQLEKCMEKLDDEEGLIMLEMLEGKRSNEICSDLGITKKSVYNLSKRLRRKIRSRYNKIFC